MTTPRTPQLNDMPKDMLIEILLQVDKMTSSPEELATLRLVNKNVKELIDDPLYWKNKVKTHFYSLYTLHQHDRDTDWLTLFKNEYKKQYSNLNTKQRKLMCALKENNLRRIIELNPSADDLSLLQIMLKDDFDFVTSQTSDSNIRRYLYREILAPSHLKDIITNDKEGIAILIGHAISCDVNINEINTLLNRLDDVVNGPPSPIIRAILSERLDVIDLLLDDYQVNINNVLPTLGMPALHIAIYANKTCAVRHLLTKANININITTPQLLRPIVFAAYLGHEQILRLLLEKGADISNNIGTVATAIAAKHGRLNCVKTLIEHNRNLLNATHRHGVNPLHLASEAGHEELVTYLLEQGADITLTTHADDPGHPNETAIMVAIDNQHWTIVLRLLEAGADANQLIDYLFNHDNGVALDNLLLLNPKLFDQARLDTLFENAAKNDKPELIDCLLQHKTDAQRFQALLDALASKNHDLLKKIIESKPILLHHRNAQHKTPLMLANEQGDQAAINLCFEKNVFEEASPAVFLEKESRQRLNKNIAELNDKIKSGFQPDIQLMIETQQILTTLNDSNINPEDKLVALETYNNAHHTISTAKFAFSIAAMVAITLAVTLACCITGAVIGALATSWSGPGAGLGALYGAITGLSYGWTTGVSIGSAAIGIGTSVTLFNTNNRLSNHIRQYLTESKTETLVTQAKECIQLKNG